MNAIPHNQIITAARRLDPQTFRVWAVIRAERAEDGTWGARTQTELAALLRMSLGTVQRSIRDLKTRRILTIARETQRATVFHVADFGKSEEESEPQPSFLGLPDTGSRSDKIGYVTGDASGLMHHRSGNNQPVTAPAPHPSPVMQQRRENSQPVASSVTQQGERSARASGIPEKKTEEKTPPLPPEPQPLARAAGGGGGVWTPGNEEAFGLLGGLRSERTRRRLAARHTPDEVRAALAMARKVPNARDIAALAAAYLSDGSAAAELKAQADKAAKRAAAAAAKPAPPPPAPQPFDAFTADRRRLEQVSPEALAAIVAACRMRLTIPDRLALDRFIAAQKPPPEEEARYQALHWTMRDQVAAAIDEKTARKQEENG